MKNKKWYVLVMMLLLSALVLSACGGDTDDAMQQAEQAVEQAATAVEEAVPGAAETAEAMAAEAETAVEEAVEEVEAAATEIAPTVEAAVEEAAPAETTATLRIWADENRIPVLESLKEQVAETIGVELILEQVALGDMAEQVRIAIPAGEGPDIFIAPHDQIGSYIDGGLISPIDLGAKADSFVSSSLTAFTYNSELYGMPYASENVAFFRNADLVPEPVETFDDMVAVCKELMDAGTIENCTVFPNTNYHIYALHTAFGGYIFGQDADGNYLPDDVGLDSEGFIASGDFIQQLVEEGMVPSTADGATADALFSEGKIPFVINGPWALNAYREAGVNYVVDPIPAGPAGPGAPFLGVQGFVVNALSEQQLLAQTFLTELVASDEIMQAIQEQDPRIPAWQTTLDAVDDEDLAGFGAISPYASPMPNIPQMGAVWGSWGDAVQVIMNGEQTAEEALTNGATQIREAIAEQ
jgi:maltose-binding protein MalE